MQQNPKIRTANQDVYACGVLLYEVIAGNRPRPGDYKDIEVLVDGYEGIDEVIRAALAPAGKRLKSAKELRLKLADISPG